MSRGSNVFQLEYLISKLNCKDLASKAIPYRGYFSKNDLVNIFPNEKECLLVNLQNSTEGNGTHHLALWKNGNDVRYFDSYGCPIPKEIEDYYTRGLSQNFHIQYYRSLDNKFPDKLIQKLGSDICGELCVLFLFLCPKYTYEEIITSLINE